MTDQPNQPYGQPPSTAYHPPAQSPSPGPVRVDHGDDTGAGGFFAALLDFSFAKYGTPSIVKIVYPLVVALLGLYYLVIAAVLFQTSPAVGVLWLLVLGPLAVVVFLAMARMTLEFYLSVVRIAQDVREVKARDAST